MRALTRQLSAVSALAVFFVQLLNEASVEHALVSAAVVGGAAYLVVSVVASSVRRAGRAGRPSGADSAR